MFCGSCGNISTEPNNFLINFVLDVQGKGRYKWMAFCHFVIPSPQTCTTVYIWYFSWNCDLWRNPWHLRLCLYSDTVLRMKATNIWMLFSARRDPLWTNLRTNLGPVKGHQLTKTCQRATTSWWRRAWVSKENHWKVKPSQLAHSTTTHVSQEMLSAVNCLQVLQSAYSTDSMPTGKKIPRVPLLGIHNMQCWMDDLMKSEMLAEKLGRQVHSFHIEQLFSLPQKPKARGMEALLR